nr:hypothetical protein [Tanacetum cinerariifolium]
MGRNLDNLSGKFLMYPRFIQVFLDKQIDGMSNHERKYISPSHTKKLSGNMRRIRKDFSGRITRLFLTMVELDDSLVRAATTASSLEAEQDSGRKINDIDADEDITLVNDQDDAKMFDVNDLHGKEVFVVKQVADKDVNDEVQKVVEEVVEDTNTTKLIVDAAQVSTAGEVNVASIATTVSAAATITTEDITLAQALVEIKTTKLKAKGIVLQEPREKLTQESVKKQKVDDDKEIVELKTLMKIILNEEDVAIDAIPLVVKSPKIVDWKIHKEGKKSYYHIIRADGKSKMYMVFNRMLKEFDREDLEDL